MIDDLGDAQGSVASLGLLGVTTVYPGHGKPFDFARLHQRAAGTSR
jgi:hypothetical protein